MAQDYTEYLAAHVLNEQQLISYRNLSRALKVHNNLAKQMLYEFHRKHNSKKPGSVHATYLIAGIKRSAQTTHGRQSQEDDEDSVMQSSPPLPSSSFQQPEEETHEPVLVKSIVLVREEHLDQARAQFEDITSIHVYSLQTQRLSDFQSLTECGRKVTVEYASEDPLKEWHKYGVIQNPHVRRRTRKNGPPPVAAAPPKKAEPVKTKATATATATTAPTKPAKEDSQDSKTSSKNATSEPIKSTTVKPAAKKSGSIFASFAKGAAKPKKTESQQTSGAPSPAAAPEDVEMTGFSDDDDDGESGLPEEPEDVKAPTGPSKKDRKAELEAMMEQEDEPMEDADSPPAEEEQHDKGALDKMDSKPDEPKETVTVENGRRRGRRRVMKKKTVKDDEGYLVTKEEAVWESFSEDEPVLKKAKLQAPAATKTSNEKKAPAKKGQGNIMSFFGKK